MIRPRTHRRRRLDCSAAIRGAQLCVFMLVLILGGIPLVEVHAHAGGEHAHSHGTWIDPVGPISGSRSGDRAYNGTNVSHATAVAERSLDRSHDADHPVQAGDHADTPADEAPQLPHVHECTSVTQAMPEVDAMVLDDPRLSSPPFPRLAAGRGTEPPAPPRRPPIA